MSAADPIHEMLRKAAERGRQIPGGCESCEAFQTLDEIERDVWVLTVHHDEWCPTLRMMKAGEN